MALQIRGFHHIVLTVSDLKRSAAFYEKILSVKADFETDKVICLPCSSFLLCLQLLPHQGLTGDGFNENRIGLDPIGFAITSHHHLDDLLTTISTFNISTAGLEYDPDGKSDYVCFRDPDNIQVEFYLGEYHDGA